MAVTAVIGLLAGPAAAVVAVAEGDGGAAQISDALRRARAAQPVQDIHADKLEAPREGTPPLLVEGDVPDDVLSRRLSSYRTAARDGFDRQRAPAATSTETFAETESQRGGNDQLDDADAAPVAQGTIAAVTGELSSPAIVELSASREDDGSISRARHVPLEGSEAVAIPGYVGDGPHGSTTGDGSGDFDVYAVALARGDIFDMEVYGDEQLDGVLLLFDASGRLVAANDDTYGADPSVTYYAEAAGTYYAMVTGYGTYPADADDSGSGSGARFEGHYVIAMGRNLGDLDWFSFKANAGDVIAFDVSMSSSAPSLGLAARVDGQWRLDQVGGLPGAALGLPDSSPLPHDGVATLSYVAPRTGTYAVGLNGGSGYYRADLARLRPGLTDRGAPATQTVYLDVDGHSLNPHRTFGEGRDQQVGLSPLADFLPAWGLSRADLAAVTGGIAESFATDLAHLRGGPNGDRDASDVAGQFDVEIMTSDDGPMPSGATRVVIGGTRSQVGIATIGLASALDVGNYRTDDTAFVLLDIMSGDPGVHGSDSLNSYTLAGDATMVDLVGQAVGTIAAHEFGHTVGNYHTMPDSHAGDHPSIMEPGGRMWVPAGTGGDATYGDSDDVRARFVDASIDYYSGNGNGTAHVPAVTAYGLATGNRTFPYAPGHVSAVAMAPDTVRVAWTGAANATAVEVVATPVAGGTDARVTVEESPAVLAGLAGETSYRVRVVARTAAGAAAGDNRPRVTTPAASTVVLGGSSAVSSRVADQVRASVPWSQRRLSGGDRFATAAAIVADAWPDGADTVFLATGLSFPDALAGAAAAGQVDAPILLTAPTTLPEVTRTALAELDPSRLVVLGGASAISDAVVDQARQVLGDVTVERAAGNDRFTTAADIVTRFFDQSPTVYVATGHNFPDALAGAAAAGRTDAPLLLVGDHLPGSAADAIREVGASRAVILGGTRAVPASVVADLEALGLTVDRLAGNDRYDTARRIVVDGWPSGTAVAYIATGQNFPDALAGAAAAVRSGSPVVLTHPATLPDPSAAALQHLAR